MFSIVAEELFLENLPVVDSISAVSGKRQSSDVVPSKIYPYYGWIALAKTNKDNHCHELCTAEKHF